MTQARQVLLDRFHSSDALQRLVTLLQTDLIQKWVPSLNKPGYEEVHSGAGAGTSSSTNTSTSTSTAPPPRPGPMPYPYPGDGPFPHLGPHPPFPDPRTPYGVGDVDLDPFAASPSLIAGRPHIGMFGGSGGGMHPGGGMFVGPDHPMFGGGDIGPMGSGGGSGFPGFPG
jgi:proteasome inhibitor subunit 1 (PI31)